MLIKYFNEALEHAHYEIIEDEEPYYGYIQELPGVWATGENLEQCRRNLSSVLEDWLLFSLTKGLSIPRIGNVSIEKPVLMAA